jgi:hypothetical protein
MKIKNTISQISIAGLIILTSCGSNTNETPIILNLNQDSIIKVAEIARQDSLSAVAEDQRRRDSIAAYSVWKIPLPIRLYTLSDTTTFDVPRDFYRFIPQFNELGIKASNSLITFNGVNNYERFGNFYADMIYKKINKDRIYYEIIDSNTYYNFEKVFFDSIQIGYKLISTIGSYKPKDNEKIVTPVSNVFYFDNNNYLTMFEFNLDKQKDYMHTTAWYCYYMDGSLFAYDNYKQYPGRNQSASGGPYNLGQFHNSDASNNTSVGISEEEWNAAMEKVPDVHQQLLQKQKMENLLNKYK